MQAYCMKCRTKREMKDAKSITMKNGKPATQGVCPVCGTKMFRIGKQQSQGQLVFKSWVSHLMGTQLLFLVAYHWPF